MEQVLPSTINYLDTLPRAVPSERRRKKFYPTNGPVFTENTTIRINIEDTRAFMDPSNTFLQFSLNTTPANRTGTTDIAGGYSFVKNFRIHQAGNEIMRIDNLNRLMNGIVVPSIGQDTERGDTSITGNGNYANISGGGAQNNTPIIGAASTGADLTTGRFGDFLDIAVANNAATFNIPLVGGLFSQVGDNKLIPLPLLSQPIELFFDVAPSEEMLIWADVPVAPPQLFNVSVISELVEVPRDVIGYLKDLQFNHGGSLAIQAQSYESNTLSIPALTTGDFVMNVPSRKRSIKSLYFVGASTDYAGIMAGFTRSQSACLSFGGNMNIQSYFLRAGPLIMPQPAVRGLGDNAGAGNNEYRKGEMFMELKKSLGHLKFHHGSGGFASANYGNLEGDNADGAGLRLTPSERDGYEICPYGLDLEAYQHEAIKSGLDTQTLSLEMQLNITIEGNNTEAQQVDIFTLHDIQYYFNSDGTITFED